MERNSLRYSSMCGLLDDVAFNLEKSGSMKYLTLYYKCMEKGELPKAGLCDVLDYKDLLFDIISPTRQDRENLIQQGLSTGWWASGLPKDCAEKYFTFTPLRQNIVLFMAVMAGEL